MSGEGANKYQVSHILKMPTPLKQITLEKQLSAFQRKERKSYLKTHVRR